MNRILSLLILANCSGVALAYGQEYVPGTYRLSISYQARSLAKTMGEPSPDGALLLGRDHIFELVYRTVTQSTRRFGTYSVEGSNITLRFKNRQREFDGTIQNGVISLNGLEYRRNGWTPASTTPAPSAVFSPDPHPPVLTAPIAPPSPPIVLPPFDPVGTWSVRNHGAEDRSSRMTFDRDGNFSFAGHGATSSGHYQMHDGVITLVWTKIDQDSVDDGTVKKDVPICADHCGFDIDTYHYERCTN